VALLDAVVVAVVVDVAGNATRRDLAEIVFGGDLVHPDRDRLDLRRRVTGLAGHAAGAAFHGLAVQRARRLVRLGHGIGARRQFDEAVAAIRLGGRPQRDRGAVDGGAFQLHAHAADAGFVRIDHAVVVAVQPYLAGDAAAARDLAEQVVHRGAAGGGQVDAGNFTRHRGHRRGGARGGAADRAGGGDAVGGAGRLVR